MRGAERHLTGLSSAAPRVRFRESKYRSELGGCQTAMKRRARTQRTGARAGGSWTLLSIALAAGLAATSANAQNGDNGPKLVRATKWIDAGGRIAWSAQGDRVAYDRADDRGLFQLYILDVATKSERCLTCGVPEFKGDHSLNPAWHPSGDYLAFQVQRNGRKLKTDGPALLTPDRAPFADLWLIRADKKDFWQLTRNAEIGSAVLDAHFSFEGDRLVWSERVASRKGRWGTWRLRTGQLEFKRGVPHLDKLRTPGGKPTGLLLAHGFAPDDRTLLFSAHLEEGQAEIGLDLYTLEQGGKGKTGDKGSVRLTHSRAGPEEYARYAPRGDLLAFTSNAEVRGRPVANRILPNELWLMKGDGTEKRRLTRFNDPLADEYLGDTYVGDFAWNPRGREIAVQLQYGTDGAKSAIFLLELDDGASP